MTLRNRFGLVILGIVIFVIVTPALVLYARGFKIDWAGKTLVKTGAIVVKTQPTKAEIFLNEVKLKDTTPANLRFITPGDYNLRVQKDGYQSWTKRLSVKSQLVTWANNNRDFLTLFRQSPQEDKTIPILGSTISKSCDEVVFLNQQGVSSLNVNSSEEQTLLKMDGLKAPAVTSQTELVWEDRSQALALFSDKVRLGLLENQIAKLQRLQIGRNHIVALIANSLYSVESDKLVRLEENVSSFDLDGDDVWYLFDNNLKKYSFSNNQAQTIFTDLPKFTTSKTIRTSNQVYLILDQTLYLLNGKLEKIYAPVTGASYDDKSSVLIYSNTNEIYTYNPGAKNSELMVRSLTPVNSPTFNAETGYIFYQNEAKIKTVELDGRDHRNIFTIADAKDNFCLSTNGKKLVTISQSEIKNYIIR
ncbi:MAG: PEGA domain-containing protein [Candidatus Doudnabacteria bacterium]|nr:PEGA domain-containing protein [Candidatus Doudnabacteria bacterium]